MKQLIPHPWDSLPATIQVGAVVKGKVVKLVDYGAFLEIQPGVEGLIHISAMSWSQYPFNIEDIVREGDEIEAMILTLDQEEKKMSLGIKQLTSDPRDSPPLFEKYGSGTKHTGIVRNLKPLGAFIELEPGLDGLLHVYDLSWTQKVNHPSEMLKVDDKVEVMILEIDQENRKLALGLKQLEDNPWDAHEVTFQVDSTHPGTVTKKVDKGALVALADNLEGFVPKRYMSKENGEEVAVGEVLDFQVLEFSKANRKIILSHKATFAPEEPSTKKSKATKASNNNTGNFVTAEKSTLGDIDTLAALKKKINSDGDIPTETPQAEEVTA